MKRPVVTALVPTYNRARLVTIALDSILRQTFQDFEIIVMDDGSADDTREALRPYASRIRYFYQENRGKSAALNRALREAQGEWVGILDSDDEWLPTKLERQLEALGRFPPAGVCFTDAITKGDARIRGSVFERRNKRFANTFEQVPDPAHYVLRPPHAIYIPTMLIRRGLLAEAGDFDEQLPVAEDTDMIFRLSLRTGFVCVNEPLICIDRTPNRQSLVQSYERDVSLELRCKQHLYEKWLRFDGLDAQMRAVIHRRLGAVHNGWCDWHLQQGRTDEALQSLNLARQNTGGRRLKLKSLGIRLVPAMMRRVMNARRLRRQRRLGLPVPEAI